MKPVDSSLYCPRLGQSGVFLVKTAPMTMLDRLAKASPDGPRRTYWASRSERELTGQTACPLCGGDASCAILEAKGAPVTDCWCFHVRIPEALLERIPPQQRGKSCLCSSCLTRFYADLEHGGVD